VTEPPGQTLVKRLAVATLVANVVIVVTGGAVRLTGSGLGCPTWPRCSRGSFVVHGALGVHGLVEFGNRMLTFVLAALVIVTWVAVLRLRPPCRHLRVLATVLLLGVPAQALLGGITVLSDLNPWVVALHLLLSLAIVSVAVTLVHRLHAPDRLRGPTVARPVVQLTRALFASVWAVLYVGTVVTGSGPHAGDRNAPRTGLNPAAVSQLHADLVFLLVGLTIGTLVAFRAVHAPASARRSVGWLLGIELVQGVVGYTQYFTGLPVGLVAVHVLGAVLVSATAMEVLLAVGDRGVEPEEPVQRVSSGSIATARNSSAR
jgi:heme a synthase